MVKKLALGSRFKLLANVCKSGAKLLPPLPLLGPDSTDISSAKLSKSASFKELAVENAIEEVKENKPFSNEANETLKTENQERLQVGFG